MPNYVAKIGWPAGGGVNRLYPTGPAYGTEAATVAAIIAEAAKAPGDSGGRPLPLATTWCRGSGSYEALSEQLGWIADGYPVLPSWFANSDGTVAAMLTQADALSSVVSAGLPFSLIADSLRFFGDFYTDANYKALSEADTAQCLIKRGIIGATANGTTSVTFTADGSALITAGLTVRLEELPGGWAALNGNTYTIASVATPQFTINVDGSSFGTYTSGGYYVGRRSTYSPWGTATAWQSLGEDYALSDQWAYLQTQYASPPRVIAVANNEPEIPSIGLSILDPRYQALYTDYASRNEKQRYSDLSARLRDQADEFFGAWTSALTETAWQSNLRFAGYGGSTSNNFLTPRFHDCYQWFNYQVGGILSDSFNDLSWTWHSWNGCAAEIYDSAYGASTHLALRSQANIAMSMRMGRDMAEAVNPDYWFEITTWDGGLWADADGYADTPNATKAVALREAGIAYTPEYYKGWTQYCLWITQPRALRNFQYYDPDITAVPELTLRYWGVIMEQVSHVHSHTTLRRFWRDGTLVENPTVIQVVNSQDRTHPYLARDYTGDMQYYTSWDGAWPRNYHLTTDLDTAWNTPIDACPLVDADNNTIARPCWALAYLIGTTPNREWLVYAHSTGIGGAQLANVTVTIPDYQSVVLPVVPVDGAFYHVVE